MLAKLLRILVYEKYKKQKIPDRTDEQKALNSQNFATQITKIWLLLVLNLKE